jgi:ribose-phosphate pyrophosphokinase
MNKVPVPVDFSEYSKPVQARPCVLLGSEPAALLRALGERMDDVAFRPKLERLPDSEVLVALAKPMRGRRGYVVQSLGAPVGERMLELALIADAAKRAGAEELVAIIPYLGYARHDRRKREDEALGAAVVARLVSSCGFSRVVTLDLHAPAVEGFFTCPLDNLSAEPMLAEALRSFANEGVIVAPDLGAAKLARRYAARLGLPLAVVHKSRIGPSQVLAHEIVGEVRGLRPIIVDDMISTGATIVAALDAVVAAGAIPEVIVAATHGVFAPGSEALLASRPIQRLLVTDSTGPGAPSRIVGCERLSLAPLIADAVTRLSEQRSLSGLLAES